MNYFILATANIPQVFRSFFEATQRIMSDDSDATVQICAGDALSSLTEMHARLNENIILPLSIATGSWQNRVMIAAVHRVPATERRNIVNQAVLLIAPEFDAGDRQAIIESLATIPVAERQDFVNQARLLINPEGIQLSGINIIRSLATIPFAERQNFVHQALLLITPDMSCILRSFVVENLVRAVERQNFVDQALLLFNPDIGVGRQSWHRSLIIEELVEIPFSEREGIVNQLLEAERPGTTTEEMLSDINRARQTFLYRQQFLNNDEPETEGVANYVIEIPAELWTRGVENYVNEIHQDARNRQVEHEQTLPPNAEARTYFHDVILDYLQNSEQNRDELIEEFESCMPKMFLAILEGTIQKAINSDTPLIDNNGLSQVLPRSLLSSGRELENLRKNKDPRKIKALASRLQQLPAVQVAIQSAMSSVLKSPQYQNWKTNTITN